MQEKQPIESIKLIDSIKKMKAYHYGQNGKAGIGIKGGFGMGLCKCDLPKEVEQIGHWEGCPLDGFVGHHTSFYVQRCLGCKGICGLPQKSFELAWEEGTEATKKKLLSLCKLTKEIDP